MNRYRKRNRPSEKETVKTAGMDECELVLRLKKNELLDKHVLLPHAEVSPFVYDAVKQFVERYNCGKMTLTIMTGSVSEPVQNIFEEAYRSHYEDEYRKISRYLRRRYVRVAGLIAIIIATFWGVNLLTSFAFVPETILGIIGQIGVFCLWEIGYTHFDRSDASEEKKRIVRARDAEIRFECRTEGSV